MKLIDKDAVVAKIERLMAETTDEDNYFYSAKAEAQYKILFRLKNSIDFLDTLEVKEVNDELAETYMQVFEKKFPILPTLKGKQLDKFKNFLNRCQQIFGLQEFGIHPVQAKLFEKLALLWAAWGAENLQGIGQVEGESDVVKEVDLDNELDFVKDAYYYFTSDERSSMKKVARHFFELGLKSQKGE